jgi:Uma2 family endonuclease
MATTQVSLEEYLRTDYEPDCDYVDGELEERNVGEKEHSAVLGFLVNLFAVHAGKSDLDAYPVIRIRVAPSRVRVADVAILPTKIPYEAVPSRPPVAIIEVLSPEDRVSRYQRRLDDYRAMGVAHIWVIDPMRRKAFDCSQGGWQPVETLGITSHAVEIPLGPLWKKLDELHSYPVGFSC